MILQKDIDRGFTLVELLVTMAIIAVLATVIIVAINPAKARSLARDAAKKTGIAQIASALSQYYLRRSSYPLNLADLAPDELKMVIKDPDGNDFDYSAQSQTGAGCTTVARDCQRAVLYSVYEYPSQSCSSTQSSYWGWSSSSLRTGKICKISLPDYSDIPIVD